MWRRFAGPAVLLACAALPAAGDGDGPAAAAPKAIDHPSVPIIRVDEVRPGMKGYGLSVFQGVKIERFDVEVLDVLKNYFPQQDLVLIRMGGQNLEHTGIIAGMSGSPVYLDGRLLGAVAYGWGFPKDPIGGVTPIESMLAELDRKSEKAVARPRPAGEPAPGTLVPCEAPLMVSGFSDRTLEWLRKELAPFGLVPMRTGGGGAPERPEAATTRLEPGSAVGVQLVRGDSDATAIGTVTYVDGDRILAFGHPMFGGGEHGLPMTTAVIHAVFAGMGRSFKFGSPLRSVGALVQDRPACIFGRLGPSVPMVPISVTVANPRSGSRRAFRAEVLQHPTLTRQFVQGFGMECVDQAEQIMGDATIAVRLTFKVHGHDPVTLETIEPAGGFFGLLPWGWFQPVSMVLGNPWNRRERLESLDLEATVLPERATARLVALEASRTEARPGETVTYRVELEPYEKAPEWRTVSLAIPTDLAPGTYTVTVGSADIVPLTGPEPEDVPGLLAAIRRQAPYRSDQLVAICARPEASLQLKGKIWRDLPASAYAGLLPGHETGGRARFVSDTVISPTLACPWVILGSRTATLEVRAAKRP